MPFYRRAAWKLAITGLALATALASVAASPKKNDTALLTKLKEQIEARFPEAKVLDLRATPIAGLYEVYTGDQIAYVSADGDYMIVGSMMDTRTKADLSAESMGLRKRIDFASLPFERAIKIVKGNGQRQVALFSDPDCPFCQSLEKELAAITNVTIYTFLYPLEELHPGATQHAKAIWCSQDRPQAWSQWMMLQKEPKAETSCSGDPVEDNLALGKKFGISGTPTLYLADGRRVDGTIAAAQLEQMLEDSHKAAAPPATAAR